MADVTPPRGGGNLFSSLEKELAKLQSQAARLGRAADRVEAVAERGGGRSGRAADEAAVRRGRPGGIIEQENKKAVTSEDEMTAARQRSQTALRNSNRLVRENVQAQAQMSQATRRQNALHTDFIQAAARGNTTLAEMRYQVGSTIAKFAGWTLAAGAVFGVVDALQHLGRGAIESLSGVNLLSRVITNLDRDKAQRQIRGLGQNLNLDLGTVGEGFFESGKVFQNQGDAFNLTQTALKATKVAELDTADSVRFFTTIVRGFRLEAGDAAGVLDVLNQVQNKFGVSIRDTASGTAKAGAVFRNAGGDYRSLIALIATIQRAGGYTGEEAGTAIRRSVEIIKRPGSVNRTRLAAFGISADQPIPDIYRQAFEQVQSGKVKGTKVNQLATALSTPQLSSRFAAALNRPDLYQKILGQTTPGAAKGSAERELQRQLRSPKEQIKQISVELERLGSALAQAGAFTGLGLLLKTLNLTLSVLVRMVELVDKIPAPFRQAGLLALELYGILRLVKRFNPGTPGEGFLGGAFRPSQAQFDRRAVRLTADREVRASKDLFEERLARQGRAQVGVRESAAYSNQAIARAQAAPEDKALRAEAVRASKRLTASELELERANIQAGNAGSELAAANKRAALATKQLRRGMSPEAVARGAGYPVTPTTFNTGVLPREGETYRRVPGTGYPGRVPTPGYGRGWPTATPANLMVASERAVQDVQRNSNLVVRGAQGIARRAPAARNALGRAATGLRSAGTGLAGMGSQLFAALGPLDLLIIGVVGITAALQGSMERQARLGRELDKLDRAPKSVAAAKAARKKAEDDNNLIEQIATQVPGIPYGRQAFGALTGRDTRTNAERNEDFARQRVKEAEATANARAKARAHGGDVPFLSQKEIRQQLADAQSQFDAGKISSKRFKQSVNKLLRENVKSLANYFGSKEEKAVARETDQRLKAARKRNATGTQIGTQFRGADLDTIGKELEALGGRATLGGGATTNLIQQATFGYLTAIRTYGGSKDPKQIGKLVQARQQFLSVVTDEVKHGQDDLKLATSDSQRNSIYSRIFARVRAPLREGHREQSSLRRIRADLQKQLAEQIAIPDLEGGIGGHTPVRSQGQRERITKLRQRIKKTNSDLKRTSKQQKEIEREIKLIQQELQVQRFDEQTDIINQRTEVKTSGSLNRGVQIGLKLQTANQNLRRALSSAFAHTREGEKRINQALIDRNQVLQEQADLAVSRVEAQGEVAAATAPTEQAGIRAQINTAEAKLGLLRVQGRDSSELLPVVADLARLRKQLAQQVIEDAKNLAEAGAEYQKSLTGSKIKEARIDLNLANREVQLARQIADPTQRKTQTLQALAKRNEARGALRLQGFQEKFDAIQFRADIGKITPEEELTQINRLIHSIPKRLLKSVDGLRDFYRDLRRTAAQLKKEIEGDTSGDLQVGNIRLPTVYDVRRLARQGTRTAPGAVVNQVNNFNVKAGPGQDAETVGRSILRTITNSGKGAARAAGVR